jgi:hypothetical protein
MKKLLLIGCLLLTAACQPAAPTPAPESTPSATILPPTETATVPPEPTLTSSPPIPPTPLPRFFTEEFDGVLPAWSLLQSSGGTSPQVSVENGALVFMLPSQYEWDYVIMGTETYTDVRIEASVDSRSQGPSSLGLICRYSESNGWYEFNISEDGTYTVLFGQWLAMGVADYKPIAADASEYLHLDGSENQIGLDCRENTLWLYLNGKLFRKLDVTRFGLVEGKTGLSVASFENTPVIAGFEWVKVGQSGE